MISRKPLSKHFQTYKTQTFTTLEIIMSKPKSDSTSAHTDSALCTLSINKKTKHIKLNTNLIGKEAIFFHLYT